MSLFECYTPSETLNKFVNFNVILPDSDSPKLDPEGKYAVAILLHGYTDDYSKWVRQTSVERYANDHGIAVVMPDAGKSFYTDMAYGDPYFTYLTEELMTYVQGVFPISKDPDYTLVAGLSMGGYGAMKIALTYPDRFKAAASFSGALAMAQTASAGMEEDADPWLKRLEKDLPLVFGDQINQLEGTQHDIFHLLQEAAQGGHMPALYVCCGTDDFIYEATTAFKGALDAMGIPHTYSEEAETHNWGYWDRQLPLLFSWFLDQMMD